MPPFDWTCGKRLHPKSSCRYVLTSLVKVEWYPESPTRYVLTSLKFDDPHLIHLS